MKSNQHHQQIYSEIDGSRIFKYEIEFTFVRFELRHTDSSPSAVSLSSSLDFLLNTTARGCRRQSQPSSTTTSPTCFGRRSRAFSPLNLTDLGSLSPRRSLSVVATRGRRRHTPAEHHPPFAGVARARRRPRVLLAGVVHGGAPKIENREEEGDREKMEREKKIKEEGERKKERERISGGD
ncbi:hypothetical protein Dimus_038218 [Dionaea muscipula]